MYDRSWVIWWFPSLVKFSCKNAFEVEFSKHYRIPQVTFKGLDIRGMIKRFSAQCTWIQ